MKTVVLVVFDAFNAIFRSRPQWCYIFVAGGGMGFDDKNLFYCSTHEYIFSELSSSLLYDFEISSDKIYLIQWEPQRCYTEKVFFYFFFFFEKTDKKNNCRFGEILTWSENMLFWGDFRSSIQKNVVLERFSGIKNDQNSFFTLTSKNVILGRFGLYIFQPWKF